MSAPVTQHEPAVRIVKRDSIPTWKAWCIRLLAVVLALLLSGLFIFAVTHLNPVAVYQGMFEGAFGSERNTWVTIRDAMMLLCVGVGLAPAFKMRFWNIGAEGQILVGGILTAGLMIHLGYTFSTPILLCIMALASIAAGALWGLIPAIFKARWGTNETLFTLMMNYVAIQLTSYCVALWENPAGSNTVGIINMQTRAGWFPKILGQDCMLNVILVMTLTVGMFLYLKYTKQGYEIAVVGESANTARYAGIKLSRVYIRTISVDTAGGRGFTAIIVAWLAKFNTFVMILIAFLLAFLEKGAIEIASQFNLNNDASNIITGIILFCIIGSEFFINYKLVFHRRKEAAGK